MRKLNYGLSQDQYDAMQLAQGGLCAVCRRPERTKHPQSGKVMCLAVDHNHETMKVRGLLCSKCNRALGWLDDDPLRIRALADYVERSE